MKRARILLLFSILLSLFATSCRDESNLVDPADGIEPALGRVDPKAGDRVTVLIMALYPDGGRENSALSRWSNIQRQMGQGQVNAAQSQMLALVAEVVRLLERGELTDPGEGVTAEAAVPELLNLLYTFVAFSVPENSEDYGWGLVDPEAGGAVVTGNEWAAVVADADATDDPVFITIELLDRETCQLADPLTQALGCWDINRYPEGEFDGDVQVEICVADTDPGMSQTDWDLLLVHHKDETGEVTPLPSLTYVQLRHR